MRFLGASTLLVPPITLAVPTPSDSLINSSGDRDKKRDDGRVGGVEAATTGGTTKRGEGFWDFELEYAPLRTGFVSIGGLRVLLLEDQVDGAEEASPERQSMSDPPVVLKEWDVIGEIWVKS
ncbi:hypothetical protein BGW80DRAFT_1318992 [Lactifluus volemus]|nr:hypothetical protein BGW80DRAFT_1318992 [Lactifluus volemus]